jgi:hypothetical protein
MTTGQVQYKGLANIVAAWVTANSAIFLQWGTGTGASRSANAVTAGSTTEARTSGTASQTTTSQTGDTYTLVGLITCLETGPVAITELGVFDAAGTGSPPVGGNMDVYGDFAAINVYSGSTITFTVAVQFT